MHSTGHGTSYHTLNHILCILHCASSGGNPTPKAWPNFVTPCRLHKLPLALDVVDVVYPFLNQIDNHTTMKF